MPNDVPETSPGSSREMTVTRPARTIATGSAALVVPGIVADAGEHAPAASWNFKPPGGLISSRGANSLPGASKTRSANWPISNRGTSRPTSRRPPARSSAWWVPDLVGLRDRALISVMTYAFGRITVLGLRDEDYYPQGKRRWVGLHEKAASATRCRRVIISKPILTAAGNAGPSSMPRRGGTAGTNVPAR
jgi:hypothetical protein